MEVSRFNFPGPRPPGFSEVAAAGPWIIVAGQIAMKDGALVGAGDPEAQARQCFANIASALALAGAELSDVVKLTCFMTDASAYPAYAVHKAALFPDGGPVGTAVVVAGLLVPGALFEVEAVAIRRDRGTG
jgi:enamine deaminase RidA (YjgF/YER057c/UK114 family)